MSGTPNSIGIGAAYGKIVDGRTTVTTSGTAVRITSSSIPIAGVWVGGDEGNGGIVIVGSSTVKGTSGSMRGIMIEPAGNSIFIPVNNLNLLYVDSTISGDEVVWAYLQPFDGL